MTAHAQGLFDGKLRSMAEQGGKRQVWVTFYTGVTTVGDHKGVKTFRVIFVRDKGAWRRL